MDLSRRLQGYLSTAYLEKELKKCNSIIYRALLKNGYSNFNLEILELCNPGNAIKREQHYIDLLKPTYNICPRAGSSFGRMTTEETRIRLKYARLNREYKIYKHLRQTFFEFRMSKIEKTIERLESRRINLQEILETKISSLLVESKVTGETRAKILAASQTAIAVEVTDLVAGEVKIYSSARRAAEALNASNSTIMNKVKNKNTKPYKGRYEIKASNNSQ